MLFRARAALPLAALLLASGFLPVAPAADVAPALVSHVPIRISGDTQLRNMALAEAWPGAGTPADPYVIQGYDIAVGASAAGIYISGTTLSLTIRDNRIHDGGHGVLLQSVRGSVRVESNVVDSVNSVGIYVLSSSATLTGNTVTNARWTGIAALYGTYAITGNTVTDVGSPTGGYGLLIGTGNAGSTITGNTVNGVTGGSGVLFAHASDTTLTGNTINGVSGDGIEIAYNGFAYNGAGNVVSNNVVGGAANGIHVYDSKLVRLTGNIVTDATLGLFAERTKDSTFAGNDLRRNQEGMRLDTVTNTTVRTSTLADNGIDLHLKVANGNLIFDNRFESHAGVWLQLSHGNRWSVDATPGRNILGGAFLGGNAWWDYTGVDADLDGLGEVPYGPLPYGALPRDTVVEDTYAEHMPYGPYDLHPLMGGPVAAGVLEGVGV